MKKIGGRWKMKIPNGFCEKCGKQLVYEGGVFVCPIEFYYGQDCSKPPRKIGGRWKMKIWRINFGNKPRFVEANTGQEPNMLL